MADENDPLSAALKRTFAPSQGGSYFPAVRNLMASERGDLLRDTENTFYGGGHAAPNPTPTPTATPQPHQLTLEQLYDHFGVDNPFRMAGSPRQPIYQNQDWLRQYGWGGAT